MYYMSDSKRVDVGEDSPPVRVDYVVSGSVCGTAGVPWVCSRCEHTALHLPPATAVHSQH